MRVLLSSPVSLMLVFSKHTVMKVGLPILESKLSSIKIPDLSGSTHVKVVGKVEYQLSEYV